MAQFTAQGMGAAVGHAVHQCPEARAVVHLPRVAQFVQQHIVGEPRGEQHEVEREVDAAAGGAASPSRVCRVDAHGGVGEAVPCRQSGQSFRQVGARLFAQLLREGLEQELLHLRCVEDRPRRVGDDHRPGFGADIEVPVGAAAERQPQHIRVDMERGVYHVGLLPINAKKHSRAGSASSLGLVFLVMEGRDYSSHTS